MMIDERREDAVSDYKIQVGSGDCHIDRAIRKCSVIQGAIMAIDEFFAQFQYMQNEQRNVESSEHRPFYARLFYKDGLVDNIMLRKQMQIIDGVEYDAINIARVGVRRENQKGKGTLKAVLDHIEKRADERGWLVICESVRGALASHLANRGYIPFTAMESCRGISEGFRNSWARLPSHKAAIINIPADIHACLKNGLHAESSKLMHSIVAEEVERMVSVIRERHEKEVVPVYEAEDKALKTMLAQRRKTTRRIN